MASVKGKKQIVRKWQRKGWKTPFVPGSMVEKVFLKALDGAKVMNLKAMILKLRREKKGGNWVLTDIRNGAWNGATWKCTEKDGFMKVTDLKMPKVEVKSETVEAKPKKASKPKKAKKVAVPAVPVEKATAEVVAA